MALHLIYTVSELYITSSGFLIKYLLNFMGPIGRPTA